MRPWETLEGIIGEVRTIEWQDVIMLQLCPFRQYMIESLMAVEGDVSK